MLQQLSPEVNITSSEPSSLAQFELRGVVADVHFDMRTFLLPIESSFVEYLPVVHRDMQSPIHKKQERWTVGKCCNAWRFSQDTICRRHKPMSEDIRKLDLHSYISSVSWPSSQSMCHQIP